jgi:NAD(P)-dependent dehydrogenase (short-subunit alcohol dehydrogenase family)
MQLSLDGQAALVTGGSRGIGAATAAALAASGMNVALLGRDAEALADAARSVTEHGRLAVPIFGDLSDPSVAPRVIAEALSGLGRLDVLVNCAGSTKRGDFLALSDEDWAEGYALKLFGTMRICRAAWPHLVATQGRIVTVAGVGARTPTADFTIGSSVNAALIALMKALADRGRTEGVRVNVVNPGYVATDRLTRNLDAAAKRRGVTREAVGAELLASAGVRRFAEAREIGELIAFLVSPRAAYVEATSIDIDGGWTRGI